MNYLNRIHAYFHTQIVPRYFANTRSFIAFCLGAFMALILFDSGVASVCHEYCHAVAANCVNVPVLVITLPIKARLFLPESFHCLGFDWRCDSKGDPATLFEHFNKLPPLKVAFIAAAGPVFDIFAFTIGFLLLCRTSLVRPVSVRAFIGMLTATQLLAFFVDSFPYTSKFGNYTDGYYVVHGLWSCLNQTFN